MKATSSFKRGRNRPHPPALGTGSPGDIAKLKRLAAPFVLFSLVTNLVILVSPIFMMQVLDRVVPSGNTATLLLLLGFAMGAIALNGAVEYGRDRALLRISRWIEAISIGPIMRLPPSGQAHHLEALGQVRSFLNTPQPAALLSLVWLPLFGIALILIHPLYAGLVGILVAIIFVVQQVANSLSADTVAAAASLAVQEQKKSRSLDKARALSGASAAHANITEQILASRTARMQLEDRADGPRQASAALSGALRMASQLLALALGAYLVSQNRMTAGGMIAASIICSKTISTIEQSFGALKNIRSVGAAFGTLQALQCPADAGIDVAKLSGALVVKNLIFPRGGGAPPRLDRISLTLEPGECLAIIGDTSGGKTTLLAALAGLAPAPIGTVTLDQTDVRHLSRDARRKTIRYVPQLADILPGTIAENICGFDPDARDDDIIAAAKLTRVHGVISGLPEGYQTDLTEDHVLLTAGQRQRLGMATALFHQPQYLLMDEPNALLDRNAEKAFCLTLEDLKHSGTTIVMVLHRAGVIGLADKVLVLDRGRASDFGPRSQVLGRQSEGLRLQRLPLRLSSLQDVSEWIEGQFTRRNDVPFAAKAVLLGTELFQAAPINGPDDDAREMQIEFKFIDDTNCEIQMIERGPTGAEKLLPIIHAAIKKGSADLTTMTRQARPLMAAAKLAEQINVSSKDDLSKFWARLTVDAVPLDERTLN